METGVTVTRCASRHRSAARMAASFARAASWVIAETSRCSRSWIRCCPWSVGAAIILLRVASYGGDFAKGTDTGEQPCHHGHGRAAGELRQPDQVAAHPERAWGMNIGARKITVSTSGLVPQIRMLAEEPQQYHLAFRCTGPRMRCAARSCRSTEVSAGGVALPVKPINRPRAG